MIDFTAYIPKDRLYALAHNEKLPNRASGAALFVDVSGFTPLTRAFAQSLGKKHGAEALLNVLNPLFEALIEPVHRFGGSVIGFAGDAITCWFDDSANFADRDLTGFQKPVKSDLRAVAAGLAMQERIAQFAAIPAPTGVEISLRVKAGIAAGSARRFLVGDPAIQRIDALVGSLVVRMAAAEKRARQGEVVVSREVAVSLGDALRVREWRDGEQHAVVAGLAVAVRPTPWPILLQEALPAELSREWVLPTVYEQLHSSSGILGDLRPVTPLMLQFGGIDFDEDEAAGEKLDAFITWVQRIVHHHGGVLLELTIGDKGAFIYAPFGAPQAHENDPARAMRAALALRDLPPDLAEFITPLQIGLTRGEVWTGSCGGNGRYTYGVMGSDVSLAARLMSHAQPGQVLVSGRMSEYPGFRLQFVGELAVKGFAQPVPTYSLLGELLGAELVFATPMVGRTAELQQLVVFAQPLFAGKLAGTAVIYGEAGIGKSRLAYALRQRIAPPQSPGGKQRGEISWFTGQTDQILRQAFNPFVYWLKGYFNQSPDDTTAQNKARFDDRFRELIANLQSLSLTPHALIAELVRTQSFLGALLGLHWDGSLYQQLDDPKLRYQNTVTAVRTLILAESRLRPVVFELEDGHWLDESSRDLLLALSRTVSAYPLLILITSRYHDDGTKPAFALDEEMPTRTLDLTALSREAVAEQTLAILGGPADPALLTLLWERSRANPFFVEQMLLHFRETGALAQTPTGDWGLETIPSDLPVNVNTMLIARIDRLTQQVKQVVQVAAVLGREFDVQLLSNMLRADVLPEVEQAESEQIWALLHELRYIFKHALLRDAAYEMQLRTRLRELHLLAANTAEQVYADQLPNTYDTLAYHYHSAYQLGAETALEKACEYLLKAGKTAQENYANEVALAYYEKLLPLIKDAQAQIEIYFKIGAVLEVMGKLSEAEKRYRVALTLADANVTAQATAKYSLGRTFYLQGNYTRALDSLDQARTAWETLHDSLGMSRVLREIGNLYFVRAEYVPAQAIYNESLALARQGDSQAHQMHAAGALQGLGNIMIMLGDTISAQAFYTECLYLWRLIDNKRGLAATLNNLGGCAYVRGDYLDALRLFGESLSIKRMMGDKHGIAASLGSMGNAKLGLGDYTAARLLQEESLALYRESGSKGMVVRASTNLALVVFAQGELDAARALLNEALQLAQALDAKYDIASVLQVLGLIDIVENKPEARARILASLRMRVELGEILSQTSPLIGLAGLALREGKAQYAAQLLGVVDMTLKALNAVPELESKNFHAQTLADARAELGEEAFNAAWAEGSRWSLEEAIAFALNA